MLAPLKRPGHVTVIERDFAWGADLAGAIAIVRHHFHDFNGNGFHPHPQEVAMQRQLRALPALRQLAARFARHQWRGVALTGLGLAGLPEAERNAMLYAIALTLGFPTSTDQRTQRVAWDVRARKLSAGQARFVTFSERVGGADMHTDSSFYPMPEEQFLLYVVRAARCGGGESLLIEVDDIARELQASAEGRAAFALLAATPLPFRVPSVYAAHDAQLEIHLATVFEQRADGVLAMRWRHDSIVKGLEARPELGAPALLAALQLLNDIIEQRAPRFQRQLPDDTLLWADNHRTLHGRALYSDPDRHLIRIRMSNTPNAERIGPSGIAAD